MKKLSFLLICLIACIGLVSAQTTMVTGTVTSAETGEPIIGASVFVKGTTTGTVSDQDGSFSLSVPANTKTIEVSYLGMITQDVNVGRNLTIRLETDTHIINEVVVTALGISREKKSIGYAMQEVQSDELTNAGQGTVASSLSGKVAGVQVNQFGGTVGASSRISIRGNSSFAADQQPLIVVDGVPIADDTQRTGDNYYTGVDYGSGINDINPNDIESISVLKGGSAALYGMRAGRGVILITTKKGKSVKGVSVSYDANLTLNQVTNIPRLQNLYGQGQDGDEMHWKLYGPNMSYQEYAENYGFNFNGINTGFDESWGPRMDVGLMIPQFDSPVTDGVYQATPWVSQRNNIRDFFRTGSVMNHMISIASNSEKANTRVSLSARNEAGTIPNTDQERYSGQFNTTLLLNKQFSVEMMANYTHTHSGNITDQGYSDKNPLVSLINWSGRQINMKSLKDNWDQTDAAGNYTYYNWIDEYHMNPYFTVNKNTNSYDRDRLFGKSSLYYQPFSFLKFEGRLGLDYYNTESFERTYFHWDTPEGNFDQYDTKNTELNLDLLAMFNKTFGEFNVAATVGANYRDVYYAWNHIGASQLTVPGVYTISNKQGDAIVEMSHSHIRSNSVYGQASIGWKSQIYMDISARNDWSSTLLDPFFYPGGSLSWLPTESFAGLKKNDILSFLKLRFGLAQIGAATTAYRNRAYYYSESSAFNGVAQMYRSMTLPNAHLRPEKIVTWEPGIEFGLFKDIIHADLTYYQKRSTDQIITVPTSNTIGFTSLLLNAGRIDTKGVEVQFVGNILRNKEGLNWTSTINYSKSTSKVVELARGFNFPAVQLGWTWGIPNQALVGQDWGVLVASGYDRVTQDDINSGLVGSGAKIGDIKVTQGGYLQSKSGQIIAHVTPKFLASWRNDFSYKNVSVGFFLDLRIGGQIWSQTMAHSYSTGVAAITAVDGIRERMILPGRDIMKNESFVMKDDNGQWVPDNIEVTAQDWYHNGLNPLYVFDGSFLKLREAYLTYNIPSSVVEKTKFISKATVSLVGSELWLMWVDKSNTMHLDPETGGVSSDTRGIGYEQAAVPNCRNFGLKLSVTF